MYAWKPNTQIFTLGPILHTGLGRTGPLLTDGTDNYAQGVDPNSDPHCRGVAEELVIEGAKLLGSTTAFFQGDQADEKRLIVLDLLDWILLDRENESSQAYRGVDEVGAFFEISVEPIHKFARWMVNGSGQASGPHQSVRSLGGPLVVNIKDLFRGRVRFRLFSPPMMAATLWLPGDFYADRFFFLDEDGPHQIRTDTFEVGMWGFVLNRQYTYNTFPGPPFSLTTGVFDGKVFLEVTPGSRLDLLCLHAFLNRRTVTGKQGDPQSVMMIPSLTFFDPLGQLPTFHMIFDNVDNIAPILPGNAQVDGTYIVPPGNPPTLDPLVGLWEYFPHCQVRRWRIWGLVVDNRSFPPLVPNYPPPQPPLGSGAPGVSTPRPDPMALYTFLDNIGLAIRARAIALQSTPPYQQTLDQPQDGFLLSIPLRQGAMLGVRPYRIPPGPTFAATISVQQIS